MRLRVPIQHNNGVPLVVRGFSKSITTVDWASRYGLRLEVEYEDGGWIIGAADVGFSKSVSGWQFGYGAFFPMDKRPIKAVTVVAEFHGGANGGAETSVGWMGLALFPMAEYACKCSDGYYAQPNYLANPGSRRYTSFEYCQDNSHSPDSGCVHCGRCKAGSICGAGLLSACPPGRFSYSGQLTCTECRSGAVCVGGQITPCLPGYYAAAAEGGSDQSIMTECLACPPGFSCLSGVRSPCPAGTWYPGLPEAPSYATGGVNRLYGIGGDTVVDLGEALIRNYEVGACIPCPPGRFSQNPQSSSCDACPAGRSSNHMRDHCIDCPTGESAAEGTYPCSSCGPGFFSEGDGSSATAAAAGETGAVAVVTGAWAGVSSLPGCTACEVGKYVNTTGAAVCLQCPEGQSTGSKGLAECA
jgi:hypothetical protein